METLKKEQKEQKLQQVEQLGEEDLNQVTGGDKKVMVKTYDGDSYILTVPTPKEERKGPDFGRSPFKETLR